MMIKNAFSLMAALGLVVAMGGCGGSAPPAAAPSSAAPTTASDSDGDGIPDNVDKCPDKKEDGLAPDPKDGCPKA
jgi:hypothetical protein